MSFQDDWYDALDAAIGEDPESARAAFSQASSPIKQSDQHQLPATKFSTTPHKPQSDVCSFNLFINMSSRGLQRREKLKGARVRKATIPKAKGPLRRKLRTRTI